MEPLTRLRVRQREADTFQVGPAGRYVLGRDGGVHLVALAGDRRAHVRRDVLADVVIARLYRHDVQKRRAGLTAESKESAGPQQIGADLPLFDAALAVDLPRMPSVLVELYEPGFDLKHCSILAVEGVVIYYFNTYSSLCKIRQLDEDDSGKK